MRFGEGLLSGGLQTSPIHQGGVVANVLLVAIDHAAFVDKLLDAGVVDEMEALDRATLGEAAAEIVKHWIATG